MFSYDRTSRLRTRKDYARLSTSTIKWVSPNYVLQVAAPLLTFTRIGITVSKKVGNAVCRNRIKRLIREFYRKNRDLFPLADCNIIARSGAGNLGYSEVCQELVNALSRIGQRVNK